ncbi:hypothetical protein DBR42_15020 [Pelomonas sp. HMWF004]|nr:hypothetical protein DBR42_15020 [Pelomonas sp. HMWF004]
MPARRPGHLCVTTADPIDQGTKCRHASPRPGPTGMSTSLPSANVITFRKLWENYPSSHPYVDSKGNTPKGFENQCAIKVSAALIGAGQALERYQGATVTVGSARMAIRAEELAAWLRSNAPLVLRQQHMPITGKDWQDKIKDKTGVVFFQDYWLRPGEKQPTGDHIDLWNGSRLTASGLEGLAVTALRFGLGINSGPGFSDLGKAKRIEFWGID